MNLNDLAKKAFNNSLVHGFWDEQDPQDPFVQATKLALIHSEVSEALEAIRNREGENQFAEELADVIIRVLDLSGALNLDLDGILTTKMEKNASRPHKHGNKVL